MASQAARVTTVMATAGESKLAVRRLYREIYRAIPAVLDVSTRSDRSAAPPTPPARPTGRPLTRPDAAQQNFHIKDIAVPDARRNIAKRFRRYSDVKDFKVAEMLRFKGELDLEEAIMMWKTPCHVYSALRDIDDDNAIDGTHQPAKTGEDSSFLDSFYNGKK